MLRLEIEKLHAGHFDLESMSENGSIVNDSFDMGERIRDSSLMRVPSNVIDGSQSSKLRQSFVDGKETARNGLKGHENLEFHADEVSMLSLLS